MLQGEEYVSCQDQNFSWNDTIERILFNWVLMVRNGWVKSIAVKCTW